MYMGRNSPRINVNSMPSTFIIISRRNLNLSSSPFESTRERICHLCGCFCKPHGPPQPDQHMFLALSRSNNLAPMVCMDIDVFPSDTSM